VHLSVPSSPLCRPSETVAPRLKRLIYAGNQNGIIPSVILKKNVQPIQDSCNPGLFHLVYLLISVEDD